MMLSNYSEEMPVDEQQQLIQHLNLDIERLLEQLDAHGPLSPLDRQIISRALLGQSRKQIAAQLQVSDACVRDQLSNHVYPSLAALLNVEKKSIAGNWALILNLLLHPDQGYRLTPPPQLNRDNLQCSFGRQIFLYGKAEAVRSQVEGTHFYQQGLYYQASQCFLDAWHQEHLPETLIYLNNSLIDQVEPQLSGTLKIYSIAVVVPFNYNQGQVATEILQGIAQLQLQINYAALKTYRGAQAVFDSLGIVPKILTLFAQASYVLKVLVVNDPNQLYNPYNQTAEQLASLATELNLMAIVGHYASEMTRKALSIYSQKGIVLINASSTANNLGNGSVGEQLSFFRITTPDCHNAAHLISYLAALQSGPASVAIIYNGRSLYSRSYRDAAVECLSQYTNRLKVVSECDFISDGYYQVQTYLNHLEPQSVDILLVIPDGGLEPNSLHNLGLISRLANSHRLIAGPATLHHKNVLQWFQEKSTSGQHPNLIACVPWHPKPTASAIEQHFCQLGDTLWSLDQLSWRSATAFDAGLMISHSLNQCMPNDAQEFLPLISNYYKQQQKSLLGVTGKLQFLPNGDRKSPPAVTVSVSQEGNRWRWQPKDGLET